ncbi:MAG: hypothetical protein V3V20_10515 [Algisphaera sp.]
MPLLTLTPPPAGDLPPAAETLVADAYQRIAAFSRSSNADNAPAFVPADYREVYATLDHIHQQQLAPTRRFCEWGSGFGVVAALAQQMGFDACGIESQSDLVAAARLLAEDHHLAVDFVHGSYIPEAAEHLADFQDDLATLARNMADGYDELGHDPEDFGVIYAFPWPGEEVFVETLFEQVAAVGALLLTYRSTGDVTLQRKVI